MTGTIELCADRETWKKRQLDSTSRDPAQRTKAVGNSGNFQLSGPHRLSHGADSRSSPRPVCLSLQPHVALPCSVSKGQSGRPSKGSDSVGRRHEAWRLCSVSGLGRSKDARADDAVQETRQKDGGRLAPRLLQATGTISCRRAQDRWVGMQRCPASFAICLQQLCIQTAGAGQLQSEDGTELVTATRMHGGMPRSAEAERESASFLQDGSAEKALGMAQLPSGMSCVYPSCRSWLHGAGSHVLRGRRA